MKRLRQFFKVSLAKVFFVSNFVICAFVFDWKEFFEYLEMPMRVNCHFKPYNGVDICISGGIISSILDPIYYFLVAIFLTLTLPSTIISERTLGMLKNTFPFWCYETFEIIYIPIFAVINAFYWICLAYMIELGYSKYRQLNPPKSKYLSVFPK